MRWGLDVPADTQPKVHGASRVLWQRPQVNIWHLGIIGDFVICTTTRLNFLNNDSLITNLPPQICLQECEVIRLINFVQFFQLFDLKPKLFENHRATPPRMNINGFRKCLTSSLDLDIAKMKTFRFWGKPLVWGTNEISNGALSISRFFVLVKHGPQSPLDSQSPFSIGFQKGLNSKVRNL